MFIVYLNAAIVPKCLLEMKIICLTMTYLIKLKF